MSKSVLFCHDHTFSLYNGEFYSPGKLDYDKFKLYLNLFKSVEVIGRAKVVNSLTKSDIIATGPRVSIFPVMNLSTIKGVISRKKIGEILNKKILNVDVVIVRLPSEIGLLAAQIALKHNKPLITEVVASAKDNLLCRSGLLSKVYAYLLEWRMQRLVYKVPNVIYVTKHYLQNSYPNYQNTIGVSDVIIDKVASERHFTYKDKYIIGLIGDPDVRFKRVEIAVKAVELLIGMGIQVELQVVGGEGEGFLKKNGALPNFVKFLGVKKSFEIFEWLKNIDVYIQPSYTEGLPRALVEAMSSGTPCIATNVGGIPELLEPEYLIKIDDFSLLASKISLLLGNEKDFNLASSFVNSRSREYLAERLIPKRSKFYNDFLITLE